MQEEEDRITNSFTQSGDLLELVPQLKQEYRNIQHKSKEFRYIRQTQYYQQTDYFVFQPPQQISDRTAADPPIPDDSVSTYIGYQLESLDLYGCIKTVCPSEYFLCEIQDKKDKKLNVMQIDKNSSTNDYSVVFSGLENLGDAQAKFVPN